MQGRWAYVLLGIGFILLALGFGAFSPDKEDTRDVPAEEESALPEGTLTFGETTIAVEIADTPSSRQKGLSGRPSLAEGDGLFFIFEQAGRHGFWMPDMHFAIDIMWLDEHLEVVYIKENATPESYPTTFQPFTPALYVLEVPSGYAAKQGIVVGSSAAFSRRE